MFKSLSTLCVALLVSVTASAQVPNTMSYQGYMTDLSGTPLPDGTYDLRFSIYNTSGSGTALWTESHPGVTVSRGLFNVILGLGNPANPLLLPFDQTYYLAIKIGSDPEMSARVRFTTSAYAFRAKTAEGLSPSASVTLAGDVMGAYSANTIAVNAVSSGKIANAAVTTSKIANDAVTSEKIADLAVATGDIDGDAVTTPKIANDAVTSEKIANDAVTSEKIANFSIAAGDLDGDAVTTPKIANDAVTTAKIANNAVTPEKIQPDIVSSLNGVRNDGGNIDLVAGTNIIITPDDAGNKITIAASGGGGGLTLPYSGTANSASPAFAISQSSGTAATATFKDLNSSSDQAVVSIESSSTGEAKGASISMSHGIAISSSNRDNMLATITAVNWESGSAAEFRNESTSESHPTINVENRGTSSGASAAYFTNGSTAAPVVEIEKPGGTGKGLNISYDGTSSALNIAATSTGSGMEIAQSGSSGRAANLHIDNASSSSTVLVATNASTSSNGDVIKASAESGHGLVAESSGTVATISVTNDNASATAPLIAGFSGGGPNQVFKVDRSGDVTASGDVSADTYTASSNLGSTATPAAGTAYRDNAVYAWANIASNGSLSGGFGCTASRVSTGVYTVTYKLAMVGNNFAPIAVASDPAAPKLAVISSPSNTGCTVRVYSFQGGAIIPGDGDVFFQLTGRP